MDTPAPTLKAKSFPGFSSATGVTLDSGVSAARSCGERCFPSSVYSKVTVVRVTH